MSREAKIKNIAKEREFLQEKIDVLVNRIGEIPIGNKDQLPFGWRNAAKGRTVWRIVEEIISQNLEKYSEELGFESINPADSEVGIYDFEFKINPDSTSYVNIKSAVVDARPNKDDISKAKGLIEFMEENFNKNYYIATFHIDFTDDMTIKIEKSVVFPTAWIPDIYVNPSNNGNLQSKQYKYFDEAIHRTNKEFFKALKAEREVALFGGRRKLKAEITRLKDKGLSIKEIAQKISIKAEKIRQNM